MSTIRSVKSSSGGAGVLAIEREFSCRVVTSVSHRPSGTAVATR